MRKFKYSLLIACMLFATTATAAGAAEPNRDSRGSNPKAIPAGLVQPSSTDVFASITAPMPEKPDAVGDCYWLIVNSYYYCDYGIFHNVGSVWYALTLYTARGTFCGWWEWVLLRDNTWEFRGFRTLSACGF